MTHEQLFYLVFHPEFSTAGEISQISGRGIGMSSIKAEVEALGGIIEVDSEKGKGMTLTIRVQKQALLQQLSNSALLDLPA